MKVSFKSGLSSIAAITVITLSALGAFSPAQANAASGWSLLSADNGGALYACASPTSWWSTLTSVHLYMLGGNSTAAATANGVYFSAGAGRPAIKTITTFRNGSVSGSVSFRPQAGGHYSAAIGNLRSCSN